MLPAPRHVAVEPESGSNSFINLMSKCVESESCGCNSLLSSVFRISHIDGSLFWSTDNGSELMISNSIPDA